MKTTVEWVPVEDHLPPMEKIEYSDGSGSYFVCEEYLVCTPHENTWHLSLPWKPMRMAWVESDTADSEKQWYDAETGILLPGVTHWLDGLKMPEGV